MEAARATSSDNSTPERDEKSTDDTAGIGRSYECGFCKRGFTNAQALGGHMNIHRKDKAKAKQKTNYDDQIKSTEKYTNLMYYDPRRDQKMMYGFMPGGGQVMSSQVYLPSPNPNSQIGNYSARRPEGLDPSLSLSIGQSEPNVKENEVLDLELRLGCGIKNDDK